MTLSRSVRAVSGVLAFAMLAAPAAHAQQPAVTPKYLSPEVGSVAPDFSLPGATRFGLLKEPVRLSDFRGKTVVLAFFYRARSKG